MLFAAYPAGRGYHVWKALVCSREISCGFTAAVDGQCELCEKSAFVNETGRGAIAWPVFCGYNGYRLCPFRYEVFAAGEIAKYVACLSILLRYWHLWYLLKLWQLYSLLLGLCLSIIRYVVVMVQKQEIFLGAAGSGQLV